MGMKSGDDMCIPLNWTEHARQHRTTELKYWKQYGGIRKVKKLAKDLYAISGDTEAGLMLIAEFRDEFIYN